MGSAWKLVFASNELNGFVGQRAEHVLKKPCKFRKVRVEYIAENVVEAVVDKYFAQEKKQDGELRGDK